MEPSPAPWEGKPRRVDIACWAAITLSGLYDLAILPWRASLVGTHPMISELPNGSTESIVSAAAFAARGTARWSLSCSPRSLADEVRHHLLVGWLVWGEKVLNLFTGRSERQRRRGQKFVARVNRWGRWFTWPAVIVAMFLPIPSAIIYAVAGWTGMSWVTFLILDAIGSLSWAGCWRASAGRSGSMRCPWRRPCPNMGCGYQSRSSFLWSWDK